MMVYFLSQWKVFNLAKTPRKQRSSKVAARRHSWMEKLKQYRKHSLLDKWSEVRPFAALRTVHFHATKYRSHLRQVCQCYMVWAISEARIKCSFTMVAFRLVLSRKSSAKALRSMLSSLSTMSITITKLATSSQEWRSSSSVSHSSYEGLSSRQISDQQLTGHCKFWQFPHILLLSHRSGHLNGSNRGHTHANWVKAAGMIWRGCWRSGWQAIIQYTGRQM